MPEVSIALPVRNAAATLPDCIGSIRGQTLTDFEVLTVDDGSEDGSPEILGRWAEEDPRVRVLSPGRIGLVAALNLAIAESTAAVIARMDADDLMAPSRLSEQAAYLRANPGIAVVGCRVELFPKELVREGYREYVRWQNACLSPSEIAANMYVESPFAHPSVIFRRDVILKAGGYADGPFPEDYDLWLRLLSSGRSMAKVPEVLLRWRERPDRASRTDDARYGRAAFDRLRARYLAADSRLRSGRTVVVWGAGFKTRKRTRLLVSHGAEISAWVDIDPRKIGTKLWSLPVHPPEWLADRSPDLPFVLVYVTNHGARELIASRLQTMGYAAGEDFLCVG